MTKYPTKSLEDLPISALGWLGGAWRGSREGNLVEEMWSGPSGNSMMGMFRWQEGDHIRLYEFSTITVEGQEIILRMKHFYPGLRGWEEKDEAFTFVLVDQSENELVFLKAGVPAYLWKVYQRTGEEELKTYFVRRNEEPMPADIFEYQRQCEPA